MDPTDILSADRRLPVSLIDGWPEQLDGSLIMASEAGIRLGDFFLPGLLPVLRAASLVLVLRIDDQVESETWTVTTPEGTERVERVVDPPTSPVPLPTGVLGEDEDLQRWVSEHMEPWDA